MRAAMMDAVEITGHISALKREGVIHDYSTSNRNPDSANGYRWYVHVDGKEYVFDRKQARAFVLGAYYRKESQ